MTPDRPVLRPLALALLTALAPGSARAQADCASRQTREQGELRRLQSAVQVAAAQMSTVAQVLAPSEGLERSLHQMDRAWDIRKRLRSLGDDAAHRVRALAEACPAAATPLLPIVQGIHGDVHAARQDFRKVGMALVLARRQEAHAARLAACDQAQGEAAAACREAEREAHARWLAARSALSPWVAR